MLKKVYVIIFFIIICIFSTNNLVFAQSNFNEEGLPLYSLSLSSNLLDDFGFSINLTNQNHSLILNLNPSMMSSMGLQDKVDTYKIFVSAFLNFLPSFGAGSFYQGNVTSGIIQVCIQASAFIFYIIGFSTIDYSSYDTWYIPHSIINVGHYLFFGGMLFGIISAIVYGIKNPPISPFAQD
jgi:hypothetical protein